MGPHDLLCKWCCTFVGKGKKFCSIFCESRYTRSKRRKLAFKRPVYSSGPRTDKEFESPRSNKTAPTKKESFLEDVITAVENQNTTPERDKRRPDGGFTGQNLLESPESGDGRDSSITHKSGSLGKTVPKLDLSSPKDDKADQEKAKQSAREKRANKDNIKSKAAEKKSEDRKTSASKPKELKNDLRSKTHTLLVSKIPVRNKSPTNSKIDDLNKKEQIIRNSLDESFKTEVKTKKLASFNEKRKFETENSATDSEFFNQAIQTQKSKTAVELERKIRSSGYGNPVNPRLRPMALKPRSATVSSSVSKLKRDSSAKSTKSSILEVASFSRDDSRPVAGGRNSGKWELVPTTIKEEVVKHEVLNGNNSLEDENPTPRSSPRRTSKSDDSTRELAKITEILREESTHSDLLSKTELQLRLSSIKKKVQVRKRGRDSRSSIGSDLETSFQDGTMDLTDRDVLNTSIGALKAKKTSRDSARSNITRISNQFQQNKQE